MAIDDVHDLESCVRRDPVAIAARKIVDHDDLDTLGQEQIDEMRADEPGPAGDEPDEAASRTARMIAMVLAAGRGTRLRGLGLDVPKALVDVGGEPLLSHQVSYLRSQGVSRVVVNAHHHAELIEAFAREHRRPPEVLVVVEPRLLGTAGGVRNALPQLGRAPFVVLYGDVLIDQPLAPLMRAHNSSGAAASITAYMTTETEGKGTVEVDDRGLVVRFVEKEPPTGRPALVNAGLYILEPEFAARIPEGAVADFGHDVLPAAAADGVRIALFQLAAPVLDVGTPDALEAARARHP